MSIYDPSIERTIKAFRRDNNDDVLNELGGDFRYYKSKDKLYTFNAFTPMSGRRGAQHGPRLKYMVKGDDIAVFAVNRNTMGIDFKSSHTNKIPDNDRRIVFDLAGAVAIYAFDIIMALFDNNISESDCNNAMRRRGREFSALSDSEIKNFIKQGRNLATY